jgi:hypothetical protein
MIRILHISKGYHAHLILNAISQTIHVPGNLFIITFPMTYPDVYLVEFLSGTIKMLGVWRTSLKEELSTFNFRRKEHSS